MDPKKAKTQVNINGADPVQSAKRLVYIITTPLGVVSLMLLWGIAQFLGEISWLDQFALPGIALLLLLLFLLFLTRLTSTTTFEFFIYSIVFIYFAVRVYIGLNQTIVDGSPIDASLTMWIPLVYILGFILLDLRNALAGSLSFFFISLVIGIVLLLSSNFSYIQPISIRLLIEFYLAGMFYIIVLYLMSRIWEQYVTSQVMADMMSRLAMTDSLTQVDNRRKLEQHLLDEIKRADRHDLPLAIIIFDIDGFKQINDRMGHATGDLVLTKAAKLVRESLRSSDHFGRWGGDEFLCIATNTDEETAVLLAERLRKEVEVAKLLDGFPVTASFGVTRFVIGDTPELLVRRADVGLFRSKVKGRNQVTNFPPDATLPT